MKITNKTIIMQNTETGQTFVDVDTAYAAVKDARIKGAMAVGGTLLAVKFVGTFINGIKYSKMKGGN